jgi:hypothetical protein
MRYFCLTVLMFVAISTCTYASPCDDIDRALSSSRKEILSAEIVEQLQRPISAVLQSFRLEEWCIIYVAPHQTDEVCLFYAHDPLISNYLAMLSGAAMYDEEEIIRSWTIENVPGIPKKLAACFAWHVTKDRDM